MCADRANDLRIRIGGDATARSLLGGYFSCAEVLDRAGNRGTGVTNLKRIFGRPDELRVLVTALADLIPEIEALAAADPGAAPLTAVLAARLEVPALFVRSAPKMHFLPMAATQSTTTLWWQGSVWRKAEAW